jgi:hypothetical protein
MPAIQTDHDAASSRKEPLTSLKTDPPRTIAARTD